MTIYHDHCATCGCPMNRYEVEDENDQECSTYNSQCGCQFKQDDYYDDDD